MAHVFDTYTGTGWRRLIGCLKLQVTFRKRASNYRALLRKMTCEDKASYYSTPLCTARSQGDATRNGYGNGNRNLNSSRFLFIRNEKRPGTIIQDLVFHFDNHFESHLLGNGLYCRITHVNCIRTSLLYTVYRYRRLTLYNAHRHTNPRTYTCSERFFFIVDCIMYTDVYFLTVLCKQTYTFYEDVFCTCAQCIRKHQRFTRLFKHTQQPRVNQHTHWWTQASRMASSKGVCAVYTLYIQQHTLDGCIYRPCIQT